MNRDLLPPSDQSLEAAVLGAVLIDARALRKALELLPDEEAFYRPGHRAVWRAIRVLFAAGDPVDLSTVTSQLRHAGELEVAGGPVALYQMSSKVTSGAHIEKWCRLLHESYARRLTIAAGQALTAQGFDDTVDALDLYARVQRDLDGFRRILSIKQAATAETLYDVAIDHLLRAVSQRGLTGLPTGWRALDELTGGWQPGDLIVLAGRPSMGKTAVALAAVFQQAITYDQPTLFFSLEMPARQLMTRLLAIETGRSNFELTTGKLPGGQAEAIHIQGTAARLKTRRILIDDTPALTIAQIRARALEVAATHGLKMLVIDYVGLVGAERGVKREEHIAHVSRTAKQLAKELGIPVFLLSQLNRDVEKRPGFRPQMSDLRESGALEQDADIIIFPWRGEKYNIYEYEDGASTRGTILLDFVKHRNGPVDHVILGCDIASGRFWDLQAAPLDNAALQPSQQFENAGSGGGFGKAPDKTAAF